MPRQKSIFWWLATVSCLLLYLSMSAATAKADQSQDNQQIVDLDGQWNSDGKLDLKGPRPSFVKVWSTAAPDHPLEFSFNVDATEISVHAPDDKTAAKTVTASPLQMLLAEESVVYPDGVVVLSALDAKVIGKKAKLETHPGSHRIGYWNRVEDYVVWEQDIPAGKYDVEIVYSRASPTASTMTLSMDGTVFPFQPVTTGTWYRYRTTTLGELELKASDQGRRVEVRGQKLKRGLINLKAVILTPLKPEENPAQPPAKPKADS